MKPIAYRLEKLHVISFDVPYPANYGGVIVVYHQLLAWREAGVRVILHAYQYGDRHTQNHLEEVCDEVHYYERDTGWRSSMSSSPYIVNSRKSKTLLSRLLEDDHPIFFEGVHTTAWISHPDLKARKKVLRMHNIEWRYYESLNALATKPLRKLYFNLEAKRLKKYDDFVLKHVDALITISEKDQSHYASRHHTCYMMPAPHGESFEILAGSGDYFLYHGKLSVEDNKKAVLHLIQNVFVKTDTSLIIAGLNPDKELRETIAKFPHVRLIANPSNTEMKTLIQEAHANILYTFQDNGLKLKLLHALHLGRYCIVNDLMVSNASDLRETCKIGADDESLIEAIAALKKQAFTEEMIEKRRSILGKRYDNLENTKLLINYLKKLGFN